MTFSKTNAKTSYIFKWSSILCFVLFMGLSNVFAQQVIGSFPVMDGGFESQTGTLGNTLSPSSWTRQAGTGSTISNTGGRSGPKLVTATVSSASRLLQSPQDPTAANGPAASTAYMVQFYYKSSADFLVFQYGVSTNGTTNPTYSTAATLASTSGVWTKFSGTVSTTATAPTTAGISMIRGGTSASGGPISIDDYVVYPGSTIDNAAPSSPGTVTISNQTSSSLDVGWVAASGGVDGGGYVVVRYSSNPNADNDPNQNGIYSVGNTTTNGTGALEGTIRYIGTGITFTDNSLSTGATYYYKVYTVDKAFNYSAESSGNGTTLTSPTITSVSSFSAFTQSSSTPSAEQSFTVSGDYLTNDLTVTAPTGYLVSTTSGSGFLSSVTLSQSGGNLIGEPVTVYVQLNSGAFGTISGNISLESTGATTKTIAVSGTRTGTLYSKSSGNLDELATWGPGTDGLGTSPISFTSDATIYEIRNRATATLGANWVVSGNLSKVVLGDGVNATDFTIPSTFTLTGTIDVAANSEITIENTTEPTYGTFASTSTLEYNNVAKTLSNSINYTNLKLSGTGTKTFPGNTTTVNGNLVLNGTTIDGPGASPFGTISLAGNLTYIGTVNPPGPLNQITLQTKGTAAGTQTISAASNEVRWFKIQTTTANTILVNNASKVYLGNASSGGLTLIDGSILDLNGNDLELYNGAASTFSLGTTGSISATSTSDIIAARIGASSLGTLRFTNGYNTIGSLTINHGGTANKNLTLGSPVTISGILTLTDGVIISTSVNSLTISNTAVGAIVGGSATSFVNGPLTWSLPTSGVGDYKFQIGKGSTYLPFNINNPSGTSPVVTVEAFAADVDPSATVGAGLSGISHTEYWLASNTGTFTSGTISLAKGSVGAYNVVASSALAAGSYSSLGGSITSTLISSNTITAANSSASLAYFVLATSATAPVHFINFSGVRQANRNKLAWSTATEMNNTGFDIQSSTDGVNFTKIGFVSTKAIAGNSNAVLQYDYIDAREVGTTYYRLRQVDLDGKYSFSTVVLIKAGATTKFIIENIYPNPVKISTTLWIASPIKDKSTIVIADELGKIYSTQQTSLEKGSNAIQLNVQTLAPGNYFIKAMNSKGETSTTQFVKQ